MKEYVVGLAFNREADRVALIRKNRPDWQAGKLNGIGGKVEPGETPEQALTREYREEAGVIIAAHKWEQIARAQDDERRIIYFRCFDDAMLRVTSRTDEKVGVFGVLDPVIRAAGLADLPLLVSRGRTRVLPGILELKTLHPK